MHDARGLTLLELLIGLTLAAALSGAAVLQYRRVLPTWELKAAVRQIALDLTAIRTRAIAEGRPFRLRFTVPGQAYEREWRDDDGSYRGDGPPIPLPEHVELTACSARGDAISFQARGYAGSFGTLSLRNSAGEERQIVVDIAGRVRIS